MRLLKGYVIYLKFHPVYQIFGIGFGTFLDFCKGINIITGFDMEVEYMNSLSYILVSTGLVGFLWYIKLLVKYFVEGRDAF